MSHLTIYTSNRMERLVEQLAEIVRAPVSSPSFPEVIVVQSKGMERWISMGLARLNGICANTVFPFPKSFLKNLFRIYFKEISSLDLFDPRVMTFRIMSLLENRIRTKEFAPLAAYLQDRSDPTKYYEISMKIADLFDQYLIFRPEMILGWETGHETHWQAILWRDLTNTTAGRPGHMASMHERMIRGFRETPVRLFHHFERISVFGISYLPPVFLTVFEEISDQIPVNLFLMNPCREFWSEIVSEAQERRISGKYHSEFSDRKSLHLEQGNRLLSSWGGQGKKFFSLIQSLEADSRELFQEPGDDSILSLIQRDIFNLADVEDLSSKSKPDEIAPDLSIKIHSCHSPMREMEVLFDILLELFDQDHRLTPEDIFIMAPDIEPYVPFIHAVFGSADRNARMRIPYRIADRSILRQSQGVEGFISILNLHDSRMGAPQIADLLGVEGIRRRFGISLEETGIIKKWIRETGVRWGIDSTDRREKGVPGIPENTWEAGIQRLLLGYAMSKEKDIPYSGIIPFDAIDGGAPEILNKFLTFFDTLTCYINEFKKLRNSEGWNRLLTSLLNDFMAVDTQPDSGFQVISNSLAGMNQAAAQARFQEDLDFLTVRTCLKNYLEQEEGGHRFISEGITFCTLLPMRSIPAKFIGLVGMNDNAFPREESRLSFDLMAGHRRPGDRSRREDDKYLFLEALLSARSRLHISFVGQNIQDNSGIPPSVLVGQLIDYISERFGIPQKDLMVRHRLHPFSPAYFTRHTPLFSYSKDDYETAMGRGSKPTPPRFINAPLPGADLGASPPDLDSLCSFFINPTAFFMKNRLGIYLSEGEAPLTESEDFTLSGLTAYQLSHELLEKHLDNQDVTPVFDIWKLEGRLPHGNTGRSLFLKLSQEVRRFSRTVQKIRGSGSLEVLSGEIDLHRIRLKCRVEFHPDAGMIRYRYVKKRAKDLLDTWIRHLCYCILHQEKKPGTSHFICREGYWRFNPVTEPGPILSSLLDLYVRGVSFPLLFFPESSFEYAWSRYEKGRSPDEAIFRAEKKFQGNEFAPGESQDPYVERCCRGINPLNSLFESLSADVFNPLMDHLEKGSLS
ncbi:MAG: exodeoxyribonuclease V subunit gamma [Thermodesulfobacteriota bacterium]